MSGLITVMKGENEILPVNEQNLGISINFCHMGKNKSPIF